jgi:hypothetical protein
MKYVPLLAGIAASALTIGIYWVGGGDFVRNYSLGTTFTISVTFGVLAFLAFGMMTSLQD